MSGLDPIPQLRLAQKPPSSKCGCPVCKKQRFVEFELNRSHDSRRRYRVLSSTRKLIALFHYDIKDHHGLHQEARRGTAFRPDDAVAIHTLRSGR